MNRSGRSPRGSTECALARTELHIVDGTYELFRAWFGAPPKRAPDGREVGATRGVLASLLTILRTDKPVFMGCATDHVIRSFRNDLWPGYKTDGGLPEELLLQFELLEDMLRAMGVVVWPMVEFEADDAMATAAAKYRADFDRLLLCTVDKDLAQCVVGDDVILVDRRRKTTTNEAGVIEKFGVPPRSIPDYLALVGDAADGYPGIPGFGKKSAAVILQAFGTIEEIPRTLGSWPKSLRSADKLLASLTEKWEDALLFKRLATLRYDAPLPEAAAELEWRGPTSAFTEKATELGFPELAERAARSR